MHHPQDRETEPGFLPMHGRSARQTGDIKLKAKVRRHERRKMRETARTWLGGFSTEAITA